MRWNKAVVKEVFPHVVLLMIVAGAICFFAGWCLNNATTEDASEPYASGALIDVTGPIIYHEDGKIEDLGVRLVALAAGETFTEEQIEQLKDLVAGLFWAISLNSWNIEQLKFDRERQVYK